MRKNFRDFIMKGNLLPLAVAFIMGAAFSLVVKSFINDLIMPIVGQLVGGVDFASLYVNLSDTVYESAAAAREAGAAAIYYGTFINALINFLIIALFMFFLVRAATKMEKPVEAGPPTTKSCPHCKTEISIDATRCPHCTSDLAGG